MSIRLVASANSRAKEIRDHLLLLVHAWGEIQNQDHGDLRITKLELGPWTIRHWTPFNEPELTEAASPGYRSAIASNRTEKALPYGLDVSCGRLLLSVLWSDESAVEIMIFTRGEWEREALGLNSESLKTMEEL